MNLNRLDISLPKEYIKTLQCANGKCLNSTLACDRNDDCGDASDEIGCAKPNGKTCESHGDNGGCKHLCTGLFIANLITLPVCYAVDQLYLIYVTLV